MADLGGGGSCLYTLGIKGRQNVVNGAYSSRRLYVNGEIPYKEAEEIRFHYDNSFQTQVFGDGETAYRIPLKKGINDIELAAIALTENPDVLATMGAQKTRDQVVIGFAAETNDVLENARKKLTKKHADMIVANDVSEGRVFGEDEDQVVFVTEEEMVALEPATKTELAERILDETKKLLATL